MATTDQLIALADRIAADLRGVSRNEWMRWVQVAQAYRINRAIHYARRVSQDPAMRSNIQKANQSIAEVLSRFAADVSHLSPREQRETFGYIAWYLKIQEEEKQRRNTHGQKHSSRHPGHLPRRGHRGR